MKRQVRPDEPTQRDVWGVFVLPVPVHGNVLRFVGAYLDNATARAVVDEMSRQDGQYMAVLPLKEKLR